MNSYFSLELPPGMKHAIFTPLSLTPSAKLACCLRATALVLALSALATATQAQDALLQNARDLIAAKKPDQAYTLLQAQEPQRAGSPDFDYVLGIAALDAGRISNAIFALERVLAVQPGNALARAELARAYLSAGERDTARGQLKQVQAAEIPPEARETVNRLLSAIDAPPEGKRYWAAYVEAGIARDSNLNSGSSSNQFALPQLPGLSLALPDANLPKPDTVAQLAAGANLRYPLTAATDVVGSVNVRQTYPGKDHQLDVGQADASVGVNHTLDANQWGASLSLASSSFDGNQFRKLTGINGQWQRVLSDRAQGSLFAQYSQLRFPAQSFRDANRSVLGAAYAQVFSAAASGFATVLTGTERTLNAGAEFNDIRLWGLRAGGEYTLSPTVKMFTTLSYERRNHGATDPLFLVERHDRQADAALGLQFELGRTASSVWRVTPQLSYTRNSSNISIYDFSRTSAGVSGRLTF
jgi:outer membrane protein